MALGHMKGRKWGGGGDLALGIQSLIMVQKVP